MEKIKKAIEEYVNSGDKIEKINEIKDFLFLLSPLNSQPVDNVKWVDIERVEPNDYNPNSVADRELQLLYVSIKQDGYTQPIVTIYDDKKEKYIIVDGFHRYYVSKTFKEIIDKNNGMVPIVVINKAINDRMASTIRHNRARGKHSIEGMSNIVFQMLDNGASDEDVMRELGMEPDELIRLKHITGFSKLFENIDYQKAWQTRKQIMLKKKYEGDNNAS